MSEEIIKIEHVSKEYRLGMIGGTTLRDELQRKSAKLRGKEDPTRKVTDTSAGNAGERFLALDDINLTINKGERVGIIGHNGAGKSTLLKLLSRITAPSRGSIELNGRIASMLEVGTGFHGELSGRENIYMNGAILGMSKAEIDSKMEDIIEFSECRQFIDTPVKRYSSGMYVKLAFSVAAHLDSEIMIMDEVLAVGDMQFQKKCLDKMSQVSQADGRTILYVSHNMNTIRQLCDRCIVLDHGRLIFDGDVEDGIAIYLNINQDEETLTFIDLNNKQRPSNATGKAVMHSFKFIDTRDCIYSCGESIRFIITWEAKEPLADVQFRMIVRYKNDSPVGLVQSESLGNCVPLTKSCSVLSFDTSFLAEGKYYLSIALFQKDDVGNSIVLDHVTKACSFKLISNVSDKNNLVWEHQWWGSIRFPNLISIDGADL